MADELPQEYDAIVLGTGIFFSLECNYLNRQIQRFLGKYLLRSPASPELFTILKICPWKYDIFEPFSSGFCFYAFPSSGFPESVVAAALARVGFKVLHLDRYIDLAIHCS